MIATNRKHYYSVLRTGYASQPRNFIPCERKFPRPVVNQLLCLDYLREVGALGAPHGGRAHAEDDGAGDERVELRVELRADVRGVAEHGEHLRRRSRTEI